MQESIGLLLVRLRMELGRSQVRVAHMLCAASGVSTVSRNEVSRWEREARVPSAFWLGWLAHVLAADLTELERAVARSRQRRRFAGRATSQTGGGRGSPTRDHPADRIDPVQGGRRVWTASG